MNLLAALSAEIILVRLKTVLSPTVSKLMKLVRSITLITLVASQLSFNWQSCAAQQSTANQSIANQSVANQATANQFAVQPIAIVRPGTAVVDESATRWNRAVLLATPRIASGDVNKLSEAVRNAVPKLTLAILASVQATSASSGPQTYTLREIGVAYSAQADERLLTVSSDSAPRLGAKLDFYSRQMLSENEKQLASVKLIVHTATLAMFDAPAIMFRDGQHKDFITRHLVWIDANTGKMALVIWLLQTDREGKNASVAGDSLQVVAPGTREDRKIHVDGRSFFLGIPSARAFALEDLPPGLKVPWSDAARQLAAQPSYNEESIRALASALNVMLSNK